MVIPYLLQADSKLEAVTAERSEEPVGFAMQWGGSRDYQAEIYRLLG